MIERGTTTAIAYERMTAHPAEQRLTRRRSLKTRTMLRRMHSTRGFTLVELMAAVAIVGILAALAVVGYKRYVNTAQSGEALSVISGIRNGEESYKAETLTYLGCETTLTNTGGFYPQGTPNAHKWAWTNPGHSDYNCWKTLNVVTDGPVRFGYAVVAGNPGTALPATLLNPPMVWPANASDNPWYVVAALGDRDGNGIFATFVGTSMSGEIARQNEAE